MDFTTEQIPSLTCGCGNIIKDLSEETGRQI